MNNFCNLVEFSSFLDIASYYFASNYIKKQHYSICSLTINVVTRLTGGERTVFVCVVLELFQVFVCYCAVVFDAVL